MQVKPKELGVDDGTRAVALQWADESAVGNTSFVAYHRPVVFALTFSA